MRVVFSGCVEPWQPEFAHDATPTYWPGVEDGVAGAALAFAVAGLPGCPVAGCCAAGFGVAVSLRGACAVAIVANVIRAKRGIARFIVITS
jgi:hypothetical protein